jgi:hypothetical protein
MLIRLLAILFLLSANIIQYLAAAAARNALAHGFARAVALSGSGLNYFSSINQRLNYYYQINSCAPEGVWGRSESPRKKQEHQM